MRDHIAIVHKDDGGAFGLTFPELPGCFAAANTWDEILKAASEALDLWFEDQPDVQPTPFDEIRNRPDVAAELAAGGTLILVPRHGLFGHF
ncbi:type II toxin-antitoxin system HicB family antitoxin [Roseovarius aestuarii]|nr:type II toxin-antitoxin system HicB family antitoxin [Roseovarius aestuarii]